MIIEHPAMQGKTLHERQMLFYNASHCSYCGNLTELVDSSEVYQESHGLLYLCRRCNAHVGTMPHSDQALGYTAKEGLRKLRIECKKLYDPIWQAKEKTGVKRNAAQAKCRNWIAGVLGINPIEAHVAMFNSEQCKTVISECLKFYPSPEQAARKKQELEDNIKLIEFLAGDFDYKVIQFALNGRHDFTLSKPGKKKMFIKLTERVAGFESKKEINYTPIKDLEKLLTNHFK